MWVMQGLSQNLHKQLLLAFSASKDDLHCHNKKELDNFTPKSYKISSVLQKIWTM